MRALEFITGHVIFELRYDPIYQMKTTEEVSKTPISDTGSYTTQPYQLGYSDGSYFMSNTYLLRKQNTAYFIIYDATFFFTN